MKNSSNRFILTGICAFLILTAIGAGYAAGHVDSDGQRHRISVLVSDSTSPKWASLFSGLRDGASEYGISLSIISTNTFSSADEQKEYAQREIDNGAEALIMELYSADDADTVMADILRQVPVIAIGSPVESSRMPSFSYENISIGNSLGRRLRNDAGPYSRTVGILCRDEEDPEAAQRILGLQKYIPADWEIVWTIRASYQSSGALESNQHIHHADVIVALDNDSLEYAVDYKLSHPDDPAVLYGAGSSEKCVYYLDSGIITAMAVPNAFNMGYLAVRAAAETITSLTVQESTAIDYIFTDKETMYDEAFQKLLFPIVW